MAGPESPPASRMRIYRGRVMHAVVQRHDRIESRCRKPNKYLKGRTEPRASGPAGWWSAKRYDYPNCRHCPQDEPAGQEAGPARA